MEKTGWKTHQNIDWIDLSVDFGMIGMFWWKKQHAINDDKVWFQILDIQFSFGSVNVHRHHVRHRYLEPFWRNKLCCNPGQGFLHHWENFALVPKTDEMRPTPDPILAVPNNIKTTRRCICFTSGLLDIFWHLLFAWHEMSAVRGATSTNPPCLLSRRWYVWRLLIMLTRPGGLAVATTTWKW